MPKWLIRCFLYKREVMKIIDIEEMKPDDSEMQMLHDGKDFVIVRKSNNKVTAWRNGKKIGSAKNQKMTSFYSSQLYFEKSNQDIIVGIKRDVVEIRYTEDVNYIPKDFAAYFVGETRLIPTRINYPEKDLAYLAETRGQNRYTARRSPRDTLKRTFCESDKFLIATQRYFSGFDDERFGKVFGFDIAQNQLMFVKNGNFHTFTIPGMNNLTCPCVSSDGLTLGVIATENKKMKLVVIDLE